MMEEPILRARITPLLETDTTPGELEDHEILRVVPDTFNCLEEPGVKFSEVALKRGASTLTLYVHLIVLYLPVTTADPFALAIITPFEVTTTTLGLLLRYVILTGGLMVAFWFTTITTDFA